MEGHRKIIYICNSCKKDFDPDMLEDEEYFDEENHWIHPCPLCRKPLNWGTK